MSLTIFTIYSQPLDYPSCRYVVRRWSVSNGTRECDLEPLYTGDDLDEARSHIPANLANVGRTHEDDPVILESWL